MSDGNDERRAAVGARLAATIAMSQTSARYAYVQFLASAPKPYPLGTPEHRAFLEGKDATLGMALCGLHAEQRHGKLQHLTAADMTEIAAILSGLDLVLSRRFRVDVAGNPLQ